MDRGGSTLSVMIYIKFMTTNPFQSVNQGPQSGKLDPIGNNIYVESIRDVQKANDDKIVGEIYTYEHERLVQIHQKRLRTTTWCVHVTKKFITGKNQQDD